MKSARRIVTCRHRSSIISVYPSCLGDSTLHTIYSKWVSQVVFPARRLGTHASQDCRAEKAGPELPKRRPSTSLCTYRYLYLDDRAAG